MSHLQNRSIRKVSIVPTKDVQGECVNGPLPKGFFAFDESLLMIRWFDREVTILLAGLTAERLLSGRRPRRQVDDDTTKIVRLATSMPYSGEAATTHFKWLEHLTEASLRWHWEAVEAVAESLLQLREIKGRIEIRRLNDLIRCFTSSSEAE